MPCRAERRYVGNLNPIFGSHAHARKLRKIRRNSRVISSRKHGPSTVSAIIACRPKSPCRHNDVGIEGMSSIVINFGGSTGACGEYATRRRPATSPHLEISVTHRLQRHQAAIINMNAWQMQQPATKIALGRMRRRRANNGGEAAPRNSK